MEEHADGKTKRKKKRKQRNKTKKLGELPSTKSPALTPEPVSEVNDDRETPKSDGSPPKEIDYNLPHSEEIASIQDDSLQTVSTSDNIESVKVIEEGIPSGPSSESLESIAAKLVTTVPVIEMVATNETLTQTSPTSDIVVELPKNITSESVQLVPLSVQTSLETIDLSTQTSFEEATESKRIPVSEKAELKESYSQVEIDITESNTQTMTPEKIETSVSEQFAQTTGAQIENLRGCVETVVDIPGVPKTESAMQTSQIDYSEITVQTATPDNDKVQNLDMVTVGIQEKPSLVSVETSPPPIFLEEAQMKSTTSFTQTSQEITATESVQTSPLPEPEVALVEEKPEQISLSVQTSPDQVIKFEEETSEKTMQTSPTPKVALIDETEQTSPPISVIQESQKTVETTATDSQTEPVIVGEVNSVSTSTSPSTEEPYEIHVEASVFIPSESNDSINEPISPIILPDSRGKQQEVSPENDSTVTVDISIDSDINKDTTSKKGHKRRKRKHDQKHVVEIPEVSAPIVPPLASTELLYAEVVKKGSREPSPEPTVHYPIIEEDVSQILAEKVEQPVDVQQYHTTRDESRDKSIGIEKTKEVITPGGDIITVECTLETFVKPSEEITAVLIPDDKKAKEDLVLSKTFSFIDSERNQPSEPLPQSEKQMPLDLTINKEISIEPSYVTTDSVRETETIAGKTKQPKPSKRKSKSKPQTSVTIEEVLSPTESSDVPITPTSDSVPFQKDQSKETMSWIRPTEPSHLLIESEKMYRESPQQIQQNIIRELDIKWTSTQSIERLKNLQNADRTTHLSDVLHLATLHETITEESIKQRNDNIQEQLDKLRTAIGSKDTETIQVTVITTVDEITTWLKTIEYRIYLNRQQVIDGPSKERLQQFDELKSEITSIESNMNQLQNALDNTHDIYNENEREQVCENVNSLQKQIKLIEEITNENERLAVNDLERWNEFICQIEDVSRGVMEVKKEFNYLIESDASPSSKLNDLERLENDNRSHMLKCSHLIMLAKGLMRDFPSQEIPQEVYSHHDTTKQLDICIVNEREKTLQLLALAEEYVQTLQEFSQIIEIAEALVESTISVNSLENLEDEMQNHRKFFVNLSHCRAILESLEENLDQETKAQHSVLHQNLYQRASVIIDKASGRVQQMTSAAATWHLLEQGMKEESKWLQVAQQRVPDLSSVTSADFDQYINLFTSLSLDISHHQAKLTQLSNMAHKLQDLVHCSGLEQTYVVALEILTRLQEDVNFNLKRLTAFRENWSTYNLLSDKLEYWLKEAEQELMQIETLPNSLVPTPRYMRQFWELKAQHEVQNNVRLESMNALEKSMQIIPVADEMLQRKFHSDLLNQWQVISKSIGDMKTAIIDNISAPDVPVTEKLALLEKEINDLKSDLESLQGVIKTEEDLNLYIERLQLMSERLRTIQNELGRLGLLSANESEKVGNLFTLSKSLEVQIAEEYDGSTILRERLLQIKKGLSRVRRHHGQATETLDRCESAEKLGSEAVEKAVMDCTEVGEELVTLWQDLMGLRQLLHTLPMRLRVTVSPIKVERDISQLQDDHTALEKRCGHLLALLRSRMVLWQRFEKQLELVQQSVHEADFMMDLFTVQGQVDYERLRKATERLEGLAGDLSSRETLIAELKSAAEPLSTSCTPEVSAKIEAAVDEAVTAWEDTCTNLKELCTRYQHATELWKRYKEASDLVREWCDAQMEQVENLDENGDDIEAVKVREETLASHLEKLSELRGLVSEIASAVGLDAQALLGGEVEALGQCLQDVRQSLTSLAEIAEKNVTSNKSADGELREAKDYLNSVQSYVNDVREDTDNVDNDNAVIEENLLSLRDHLVGLSKTEIDIQKMKEQQSEMPRAKTDVSILEILKLWQQVFRETFQEYHRLSSRLIKNEDGAAALKLWQEYIVFVQQFLSESIPGDFKNLSEHNQLCEIHHNLLLSQQDVLKSTEDPGAKLGSGVVEESIVEKFNTLTNLHNETLAKIVDRREQVKERLKKWEEYRNGQNKLLAWLKDIEKDRERLQLRYIHLRRVPVIQNRIQALLNRIPSGEYQSEQLNRQLNVIVLFCDEALSTSIRMEHAAITQRISNLQAGLQTWNSFLDKISLLVNEYEERIKKVQIIYSNVREIIADCSHQIDESKTTHTGISNSLENLRQARIRLNELTKDLEQLGVIQEQLKECVSPFDMKTINQRMWLLWHEQGDLDHQLATLCHKYEDKLSLRTNFEMRQARFMTWSEKLLKKMESDTLEKNIPMQDPDEAVRLIDTELRGEMTLKEREYNWLLTTGEQLHKSCGDEYSDVVAKQNIKSKVDEVRERWQQLENVGQSKLNKINDMAQTMSQLELKIAEIKAWLHKMELELSKPIAFENCTKESIDKLMEKHHQVKKLIEKESADVGEVLNLCELLLSDVNVWKMYFDIEQVASSMQTIEKRWKNVCGVSAEQKRKIAFVGKLLCELRRLTEEHNEWLNYQEEAVLKLDRSIDNFSTKEILQKAIAQIERQVNELESRGPVFEVLEQTYSKITKTNGLETDSTKRHVLEARKMIMRWHCLLPKAQSILERFQSEMNLFKDFSDAHGNAVMALTRIDAKIVELEHLSSPELQESPAQQLAELEKIEDALTSHNDTLENADRLGLLIMEKHRKETASNTQEMIDEYQVLWKNIQQKLITLKSDLRQKLAEKGKQIADESVQVETLKFEQDIAVQVNTLPPKLQRMTSITAKDAYVMELSTALEELKRNMDDLEDAVQKDIPQKGSPELHSDGKLVAKLTAACQSSTELIKHLRDVLLKECAASEEESNAEEIDRLLLRFEKLAKVAKKKELAIKELRLTISEAYVFVCEHESGRVLCPFCTNSNWSQLDNDLWRLEQWLQAAEGIQSSQNSPPTNIELLEDMIQDHREFLLDLESHMSIMKSLNIVGNHLAEHTEDPDKADKLRERLERNNTRWDVVCVNAAAWQTILQKALLNNRQFHSIVGELTGWIEETERQIRSTEPIDLTVESEILKSKYNQLRELKSELERCEPRVLSLQEAAIGVFNEEEAPEECNVIMARITDLKLKLQSLIRVTGIYVLRLGASLGLDPNEIDATIMTTSTSAGPTLHSLSYDLLDQASSTRGPSPAPGDSNDTHTGDEDDVGRISVLRRSYKFLGRVVRASLPIQAMMLLLLGAASLVPTAQDDYSCLLVNNFANSFTPMLRYNDGPPPL